MQRRALTGDFVQGCRRLLAGIAAGKEDSTVLDKISLILTIVGALNWGLVGLFQFDLVAWIFGSQAAIASRVIYIVIALAGLWCVSLLFRDTAAAVEDEQHDAGSRAA